MRTQIQNEVHTKKGAKMRFTNQKEFKTEEYIKTSNIETSTQIMKLRLNMVEARANYKANNTSVTCGACKEEDETTEHLLQCKKYKELTGDDLETDNIQEYMGSLTWQRKAIKKIQYIYSHIYPSFITTMYKTSKNIHHYHQTPINCLTTCHNVLKRIFHIQNHEQMSFPQSIFFH